MKTHLLNSAMMPVEGRYRMRKIYPDEFADLVRIAHRANRLVSSVGYFQNAKLIAEMSGVPIPLSRDVTRLNSGDEMLIMKLKYRPDEKGKDVRESDFEYYHAWYD